MQPGDDEGQPRALVQLALGAEMTVGAKALRWGDCPESHNSKVAGVSAAQEAKAGVAAGPRLGPRG